MPVRKSRGDVPPGFPPAYWARPGAALYLGDVCACLRSLPARSVHCVVTSPPYWGLRDYGTGPQQIGVEKVPDCVGWATHPPSWCNHCYVCHLVEVLTEVRRVLRDDGTVWLNLGDSYSGGELVCRGNLVGIPWRVALALQADGWILRQDIIWAKPNPMPESVTNRCTKSHEYIFLLAKSQGYYYDALSIAEPAKSKYRSADFIPLSTKDRLDHTGTAATRASLSGRSNDVIQQDANKRDVWTVATKGYPGAHFATFSPRLITPCILAGTSEYGACAECGRPYERIVSRTQGVINEHREDTSSLFRDRSFNWSRNGLPGSNSTLDGVVGSRETVGWRKMCVCQVDGGGYDVVPCVVLDPFVGSGTTVATALDLGRTGIGVDLSEKYLRDNAIPRIEIAIAVAASRTRLGGPAG